MKVKLLVVAVGLLLLPVAAQAQTHYCDQAPVTTGTATAGQVMTIRVCHSEKDTNGNPTMLTGWAVYVDALPRAVVVLTPTGTVSPVSGKREYTGTTVAPASAGPHSYQVAPINAVGEDGKTTPPFVLTVSLPQTVPAAGSNLSLQ